MFCLDAWVLQIGAKVWCRKANHMSLICREHTGMKCNTFNNNVIHVTLDKIAYQMHKYKITW